MINDPLVVTVVVHYNSPGDCINMLSSLVTVTYPNHRIVVVDNCSNSSDYEELKDAIKDKMSCDGIDLIKNNNNVGYGGGINFAIKYAERYNPAYVHVINTDAEVINPLYVSKLVNLLEINKDIGIVGPAVLKENRQELQNTILPFVTIKSALNFKIDYANLSYAEANPTIKDVECVNGVCFLIPFKVFESVGGFDESYFMYGEEQDLCYKIYLKGLRRVFWSGLSIVHYGAEKSDSHLIDWRFILVRKNQVAYLGKHHNLYKAFLLASLFSLSLLFKLLKGNKLQGVTTVSIIRQYYSSTIRR